MLVGKIQKKKCRWTGLMVYQLRCDEPGCNNISVATLSEDELIAIYPEWLMLPDGKVYCQECRQLEKNQN